MGDAAAGELAAMPPSRRPTAVPAAIDLLAFGALRALLQHEIRLPADVSPMGYDDTPFARPPHYEMGTTAAQLLTRHTVRAARGAPTCGLPAATCGSRVHWQASHPTKEEVKMTQFPIGLDLRRIRRPAAGQAITYVALDMY